MAEYQLRIELLSDTAFGRGDGVAGLVDSEVEHDATTGLPFVKGRTLKGLVVEACADLLFGLNHANASHSYDLTARVLFGEPGSTHNTQGILHFGNATLPDDTVQSVNQWLEDKRVSNDEVLEAMTAIRQQTAVDRATDTPLENSLRAIRVVLRGTIFHAPIISQHDLSTDELSLLVASFATVRRGGQNRTRGLGRIQVELMSEDNDALMTHFAQQIGGA